MLSFCKTTQMANMLTELQAWKCSACKAQCKSPLTRCYFRLHSLRLINADTFLSVQIIQPESHLNAFNEGPGSTGSKESLSIYGLFHHLARTPQGRARLRQLFLLSVSTLKRSILALISS